MSFPSAPIEPNEEGMALIQRALKDIYLRLDGGSNDLNASATDVTQATVNTDPGTESVDLSGYLTLSDAATTYMPQMVRATLLTSGTSHTLQTDTTVFVAVLIGGGGGGSGGGSSLTLVFLGCGGGSGALVSCLFPALSGTTVAYTIGGAGSGGTGASGSSGGATTLTYNGVTISANGGGGGNSSLGSFGGSPSIPAVSGDFHVISMVPGNAGQNGSVESYGFATGLVSSSVGSPRGAAGHIIDATSYGRGGNGSSSYATGSSASGSAGTQGSIIIYENA